MIFLGAQAQAQNDAQLVEHLRGIYSGWRTAVMKKDAANWLRYTAESRKIAIRNRLWSERRRFPDSFFNLPTDPPDLSTLQPLRVRVKGPTVKAVYFGKVDFGVGVEPTENILTVSYVKEASGWKYDGSEFVNLSGLPEVRKQILAKDYSYVDQEVFQPTGIIERPKAVIKGPAKYIAKAYVYCPGREVKLLVNKISTHTFQDTKGAEVVLGGAVDGRNEVQFAIKDIPGGDPKAPMTMRVYLMSEIDGQQPLKPFEYQITDGSKPESSGTRYFTVTPEMAKKLR